MKKLTGRSAATLAADDVMLRAMDSAAASEFLTRSAWMRRTIARELERCGHLPSHIRVGRRQADSVQLGG